MRIRIPFLLLAVAAMFVPESRCDELLQFDVGNGEWTWTMQQGAQPDQGSVAAEDFTYLMVQTFSHGIPGHTFDMHFFRLHNSSNPTVPDTTNLIMNCDPFGFPQPDPSFCDYFNWIQIDSNAGIWTDGPGGRPEFLLGTYGGLTITEAPEPSALALLFAGLLAVARRAKT